MSQLQSHSAEEGSGPQSPIRCPLHNISGSTGCSRTVLTLCAMCASTPRGGPRTRGGSRRPGKPPSIRLQSHCSKAAVNPLSRYITRLTLDYFTLLLAVCYCDKWSKTNIIGAARAAHSNRLHNCIKAHSDMARCKRQLQSLVAIVICTVVLQQPVQGASRSLKQVRSTTSGLYLHCLSRVGTAQHNCARTLLPIRLP